MNPIIKALMMGKLFSVFTFVATLAAQSVLADSVQWKYPLYLDAGTPAPHRIGVEISNKTEADFEAKPVEISAKELGLAGVKKSSLRVVSDEGKELLFAIRPDTDTLGRKSKLIVPADCRAKSTAKIYIYYGSRDALELPDYYYVFEKKIDFEGALPLPDGTSFCNTQNFPEKPISDTVSHGGKNSLKVGRGTPQNYLDWKFPLFVDTQKSLAKRMFPKADALKGGDNIVVSAYVKTDDVSAKDCAGAGIAVVLSFENNKFRIVKSAERLSGTSDWKKISVRVKVPKDCIHAAICTLTDFDSGSAYFDDFSVRKSVAKSEYEVKIDKPETLKIARDNAPRDWEADKSKFNLRTTAVFYNLEKSPTGDALGFAPISIVARGNFRPCDYKVFRNGKEMPSTLVNGSLYFMIEPIAAESEARYNIYIAENRKNLAAKVETSKQASYILSDLVNDAKNETDLDGYSAIFNSKANMIKDGGFEQPSENGVWKERMSASKNSGEIARVEGGAFGKYALRIKFNENFVPKKEVSKEFKFPGGASSGKKKRKASAGNSPSGYFGMRQQIGELPAREYAAAICAKSLGEPRSVGLPRLTIKNAGAYRYAGTSFVPEKTWTVKFVRVQLKNGDDVSFDVLNGGSCNALFDGAFFGEIRNAQRFEYSALSDFDKPDLKVWQVNPIVKVFDFFAPPANTSKPAISLAKNEYENLQLALRSTLDGGEIEVDAPAPALKGESLGGSKNLASPKISVAGTVVCDAPSAYTVFNGVKYNERCVPKNSMIQKYPDPLVSQNKFDLPKCETKSVWLNFYADADTKSGLYEGTVDFKRDGKIVKSVPYSVRVRNFAIPKESGLGAIFDARGNSFSGGWRARKDIAGITSKFYDNAQLQEFLARYRMSIDKPDNFVFYTDKNGNLAADFTKFDKFCEESFGKLGVNLMYLPQVSSFSFANRFSRLVRKGDEILKPIAPYEGNFPYPNVDLKKLRPEYVAELQARVKLIYAHLKERGWQNKFLWYVCDEPHCDVDGIADMTKAYCAAVKAVEPDAQLYSSTWAYIPMLAGGINVWGMNMSDARTPSELEIIAKRGETAIFTTDGNYCINTPYCAQERIIPLYCFAGGLKAHEFWGVDWYTLNPFKWGMHYDRISSPAPNVRNRTRYPNGDGYFVYSGELIGRNEIFPSVRIESIRDGQEDFEYFKILEKLANDANDPEARKTLEKVRSIAIYPNARGTNSAVLMPDPDSVLRLRDEVAAQIERLQRSKN